MRYRLDVVAPSVSEVVSHAGGWLVDRVMAGWDVTVLISGTEDLRPLLILGVEVEDLEVALEMWAERPHPQTVAVSANLFTSDARVREGVMNALDHGMTEVTLWGDDWPDRLDATVGSVEHHLSAAAVVDPVGGALSEPALRSLRRGGRFVTVGYASGEIPRIPLNLVLVKGIRIVGFQFQDVPSDEFARNEGELHELLATGRVSPHVGATYPLADTAAALRHVADGRAIGKVLIDVSGVG